MAIKNPEQTSVMTRKKAFVIFAALCVFSIIIVVVLVVLAINEENLVSKIELIIGACICGSGTLIGVVGFIVVLVMLVRQKTKVELMTREAEENLRQVEKLVDDRE